MDKDQQSLELSGNSREWFGCQLYWFNDATTWTQVGGLRLDGPEATPEGRMIERVYRSIRREYPNTGKP